MTLVYGKVEALNKVKYTLEQKGVSSFKSIRDINLFLDSYDTEINKINGLVKADFLSEIEEISEQRSLLEEYYNRQKKEKEDLLESEIAKLRTRVGYLESKRLWGIIQKSILVLRLKRFERRFDLIIARQISSEKKNFKRIDLKVRKLEENKDEIISERIFSKQKDLKYIKRVVDELYPVIAGAVGESLVEKELQKLSDDYILVNDFSLEFNPPIYNKRENDRIFSVQIDHLLISKSGIFVLETKNWSKKSLIDLDLRSPVKQILRSSYALFVLLNSNRQVKNRRVRLKYHHWGEKQIPIRNVIVMINQKPRENFKHVQVKRLDELIRYVEYFEPIMDNSEVNNIYEYLKN